jgi:hypothetical protein
MDNWFNDELDPNTIIDMSDSGYTNDEIGVQWLKHFILHTKSGLNTCKKLLIYDRHGSHNTNEFKCLAAANNIFLLMLPPHLTHILQPLDVGVFQTYKHCHNLAVHQAIRSLQFEYNYSCFLRDLPKIREKTFTEKIIVSAWAKAGLFPPDQEICLRQMKKYSDPEPEYELPPPQDDFFRTPKTIRHTLELGQAMQKKCTPILSSPSRRAFESWQKGNEEMLRVAHAEQGDLMQIRLAAKEAQKRKATCRNYTTGKGSIRVEDALVRIAEKEARKAKKAPKKPLIIEADDEDSDDSDLDSEMGGFAFGADMAGVPDYLNLSQDYIPFD